MDCSLPDSVIHGIFQARILEWVVIPFSRGSSWSKNRTQVSWIAGRLFTIWATREALVWLMYCKRLLLWKEKRHYFICTGTLFLRTLTCGHYEGNAQEKDTIFMCVCVNWLSEYFVHFLIPIGLLNVLFLPWPVERVVTLYWQGNIKRDGKHKMFTKSGSELPSSQPPTAMMGKTGRCW